MNTNKIMKTMMIWSLILQLSFCIWCTSIAFGGAPDMKFLNPSLSASDKIDMSGILLVLENRVRDKKLLEKTKYKLFSLDNKDIRLIASLCEQISRGNNTPGSDIAFSLVSALIVLS